MAIYVNFVAPGQWLLTFLNYGPFWKPSEIWGTSPLETCISLKFQKFMDPLKDPQNSKDREWYVFLFDEFGDLLENMVAFFSFKKIFTDWF